MAPLVDESDIRKELSIFEGIEADKHYSDFVAISSFLSDRTAVAKALQHLEQRLLKKGEALWKTSSHYQERFLFYRQNKMDPSGLDSLLRGLILCHFDGDSKKDFLKHLFSSSLTDLEAQEQFDLSGYVWEPRSQYYLGVVSADSFREQIRAGRPQGKDPFVDKGHGEYTHRVQWYAIMSPASSLHLKYPAVQVYKAIGRYAAPEGSYGSFQWGLWDALCDRDNGTAGIIPFKSAGEADFRCPNNLNSFLRDEGLHFDLSLVGAFLEGRYQKRSVRRSPLDYAASKVFGKANFDLLSEEQQMILQKQLGSLEAVYDPRYGFR